MAKCMRCGEDIYDRDMCGCPTLILVTEGEGDVKFWQHKDHGPHRFGDVRYPDGTGDGAILVHQDPTRDGTTWFTAQWEWEECEGPGVAGTGKRPVAAGGAPEYVVTDITRDGCGAVLAEG